MLKPYICNKKYQWNQTSLGGKHNVCNNRCNQQNRKCSGKLLARERAISKGNGRNAERLAAFAEKGADIFVAEPTDKVALMKAFTGAKAVYIMLHPNYITTSNDFLWDTP